LDSTPNGAEFIGLGADVYFGSGGGLWRLPEGATVATRLKADQVYAMTVLGNQVLFLTTTGLWKTDGTPAGTVQVKQLGTAYFSRSLVTLGGAAYFDAGSQLYRSDGTAVGTQPVIGTKPSGQPPPYVSSAL